MAESKQPGLATGVYAALLTPRRPDSLEPHAGVLLDYLETVARAGVDGLVLFGATGEFAHFDVAERRRVTLVIRRSRVPVLVNVSHSTLDGSIDLAQNAITAGASGLLLMPPYFYRYAEEQIFEFYQHFARQTGSSVPIYLYNLPFFTSTVSVDLAGRLLGSRSFAGIKDSSGDWQMFQSLLALRSSTPFSLLVGNESLYLRGRQAGADGIVSGVAAAVPELPVAIDRAIRGSDWERAQTLNVRLREFIERIQALPATAGIKQAAAARGWVPAHAAVPFDTHTAAELASFEQWFRAWLPEVLSSCTQRAAMGA
jgi:dihydrodipicolinate synthase/N-acetylneuraminate lyase